MMRTWFAIGPALILAVGLAACSQTPPPAPPAAAVAGPPPAPTLDQLKAATVSGVLEQPVTLAGGVYEGPAAEAGAASRPTLTLWVPTVGFANVDSVPGDEAVALLSTNSGGSGEFVHVAVFGIRDGRAVSLAMAPLGDRVKLHKLWVEQGRIQMDVIEAGPKDPACCPTQLARKSFTFQGGALKQESSDVVGSLSVNLLSATDWVLAEMDGQRLDPAGRPPTLLVQHDNVVGFGGCNRYTGALKETSPGTITVGPLASTRKACPAAEMDLEDKFTSRMNKVTSYTFLAGQLALTWGDKQGGGLLVFSR
jgi:heat shock protein HslJ